MDFTNFMDFTKLNLAVDGDSITEGEQWSAYVYRALHLASHYNVAVSSAVWYKRTFTTASGSVTTQDYNDPGFAGISDGWLPTDDLEELQKRANNCAVVHIQQYIQAVHEKKTPVPDIFAFAMGANDGIECLGSAEDALAGKSLQNNDRIDLFTEAGAVRWCLQRLLEEFPDCRIFVLTPIPTAEPIFNRKMEPISEVLKTVAGGMSVPCIDCLHNCGITEKFETANAPGRYFKDGSHPNEKGQELMGRYIAKEIRNNMF